MSISWPWWLNPWREARLQQVTNGKLQAASETLLKRNGDLRGTNERQGRQISILTASLDTAQRQLRELTGGTPEGASTPPPDFVLVGIGRPDGSKRLIASRDLPGVAFGMTDMSDPPPRWQIRAVLVQPLMIDRPNYATALDHLRTVWSNWDHEAAMQRRQVAGRWTEGGRAGRGRPAIQPYTGDAADRVAIDRAHRAGKPGELPPAG